MKFEISSRLDPCIRHSLLRHYNSESNRGCVIYSLWGDPGYITYLKYSLLGLTLSTDVSDRADVLIFVSKELHEKAQRCLDGIVAKDCFVVTELCQKYLIPLHPYVRKYDYFLMLDADAFFLGKKNVFEELERFYENQNNRKTLFMLKNELSSEMTFWSRKAVYCPKPSDEKYESFFRNSIGESFEEVLREPWWISCAVAYSKEHFREDEYLAYATENSKMEQRCDETVFIAWSKKQKYELRDIEKFFLCFEQYVPFEESASDFFVEQGRAALYHPLVGENALSFSNVLLLAEIEKNYLAYVDPD